MFKSQQRSQYTTLVFGIENIELNFKFLFVWQNRHEICVEMIALKESVYIEFNVWLCDGFLSSILWTFSDFLIDSRKWYGSVAGVIAGH